MTIYNDKFCPECGGNNLEKVRINGADTGDLACVGCKNTDAPGEFLPATAPRTCKHPKCKRFIPAKQSHLVTMAKDNVAELKQGYIRCPYCKARHRAEDVQIAEKGSGTGTYFATFGALAPG